MFRSLLVVVIACIIVPPCYAFKINVNSLKKLHEKSSRLVQSSQLDWLSVVVGGCTAAGLILLICSIKQRRLENIISECINNAQLNVNSKTDQMLNAFIHYCQTTGMVPDGQEIKHSSSYVPLDNLPITPIKRNDSMIVTLTDEQIQAEIEQGTQFDSNAQG